MPWKSYAIFFFISKVKVIFVFSKLEINSITFKSISILVRFDYYAFQSEGVLKKDVIRRKIKFSCSWVRLHAFHL